MKTVLIITLSIGLRSFCGGCPEDIEHDRHEGNAIAAGLGAVVASAVERGNKALIARQHADDGSWGGDDVKVRSSHKSDYPVAISSLADLALMATAPEDEEALRARERSLQFILDTIEAGRMKNTRDNTPKVHERNVPVLQEHFLRLQKPDGHWIDSRDHCGESYGTAMGLLVLSAPRWAR